MSTAVTMHPRTRLWISLTVIVVELVYSNAAINPGNSEEGRLLPQNYSFPIVSKDGTLYYDLSGAAESEMIYINRQSVRGITATHSGCRLRNLHVLIPYRLDEDLLKNCPQLSIKLGGNKWKCAREGRLLVTSGAKVDLINASCTDAWYYVKELEHYFKFTMEKGVEKLMEFGITNCSAERCECKWYFKNGTYTITVDCEGVGLTDDTIPILPSKVSEIRMGRNNLTSMDNLVKHLLPLNHTLTVLGLDDNMLESFPSLPNGSFPNLESLSLVRNKMKRIDLEAFKNLITRKNLLIHLEDNIFVCDCNLYEFKVFLERSYIRHWKRFKSFMKLECRTQEENKMKLVYQVSKDVCKTGMDWLEINWTLVIIFILSILNLIMVYLMLDLVVIIKFRRHRRPTMDRVVCGIKSAFYWPFSRREETVTFDPVSTFDNVSL